MARIRSIHPKALESRKLRKASAEAERTYWRLQVLCDDEGRVEDDVELLADMLYPASNMTPEAVDEWLWQLADLGLIARYVGEGVEIVQVVKWKEFQHPQKPTPSKLAGYHPGTERLRDHYERTTRVVRDPSVTEGSGGDIGEGGTAHELSTDSGPSAVDKKSADTGVIPHNELTRLRRERTGRRTF